jgi:hypothetical protein
VTVATPESVCRKLSAGFDGLTLGHEPGHAARGIECPDACVEPGHAADDRPFLRHDLRLDAPVGRHELRGPVATPDVFHQRVAHVALEREFKRLVAIEVHGDPSSMSRPSRAD